jgi:hypothetical protein
MYCGWINSLAEGAPTIYYPLSTIYYPFAKGANLILLSSFFSLSAIAIFFPA